jgi:aconitate hydratase
MHDEFKTLKKFDAGKGREGVLYSLPALEERGIGKISRLPISIRIVLESVLRNCDGKKVRRKDVETLANWNAKSPANEEIPFIVARIVLQDFTGVPLVVDLAAMRSAVKRLGGDPKIIEPLVPVDLVVDHSVQVDFFGSARALQLNLDMEFKRNRERYQFLKWGQNFPAHPAGHRHRSPGKFGVPGQRRSLLSTLNSQLSTLLPRHAGRH